jgi:hypothetical protein
MQNKSMDEKDIFQEIHDTWNEMNDDDRKKIAAEWAEKKSVTTITNKHHEKFKNVNNVKKNIIIDYKDD